MLNSLQACRTAAALLVVLYHTSHGIFRLEKYFGHKPFGPIFDFGFAGVDFFFVLSGFIMMHVHAEDIGNPSALPGYLWKRFSRIYPAYWVIVAALMPVYFLVPSFGFDYQRDPDVILRAIFLYPHPQSYQVLGVAWTLVYEMLFYVLFGLLILDRRVGAVVLAAWTGGLFLYPWFEEYLSPFVFNNMNLRFLAGIGVALVLARWQIPWPRLVAGAGATVFLFTGAWEACDGPLSAWTQCAGYTIGSALMLAGVVQAERSNLLTPPGWLVYLGNASYSIYLVHFLALSVFAKVGKAAHLELHVPGAILFCLYAAGSVGVGCAYHHFVEHPIHRWAKRFFRRAEATAVPEPAHSRAA